MEWTKERKRQLELLEKMIHELTYLNHSTGCLRKLESCVEIANLLSKTSFIQLLGKDAFDTPPPAGQEEGSEQ